MTTHCKHRCKPIHPGYVLVRDRDQIAAPFIFQSEFNSFWAYERAVFESSKYPEAVVAPFARIQKINKAGVKAMELEIVMVNEGKRHN